MWMISEKQLRFYLVSINETRRFSDACYTLHHSNVYGLPWVDDSNTEDYPSLCRDYSTPPCVLCSCRRAMDCLPG